MAEAAASGTFAVKATRGSEAVPGAAHLCGKCDEGQGVEVRVGALLLRHGVVPVVLRQRRGD